VTSSILFTPTAHKRDCKSDCPAQGWVWGCQCVLVILVVALLAWVLAVFMPEVVEAPLAVEEEDRYDEECEATLRGRERFWN